MKLISAFAHSFLSSIATWQVRGFCMPTKSETPQHWSSCWSHKTTWVLLYLINAPLTIRGQGLPSKNYLFQLSQLPLIHLHSLSSIYWFGINVSRLERKINFPSKKIKANQVTVTTAELSDTHQRCNDPPFCDYSGIQGKKKETYRKKNNQNSFQCCIRYRVPRHDTVIMCNHFNYKNC